MAKILVTGGAGFIGSHIVDDLLAKKHRVVIIDNLSSGYARNVNSKAKLYRFSIDSNRINGIFRKEKFDYVFHLAGQIDIQKSIDNPVADATTNIVGSINIIQQSADNKVKKMVFASTGGAIYGETKGTPATELFPEVPVSPYGIGKLAVEKYLEYFKLQYGLDYTIMRYSNVYGPRQNAKGEAGVVAIFIDNAIKNLQSIIYGNGKQTRDFLYVGDAVRATVMAIKKNGKVMNVSTTKETSILQLYNKIMKIGNFQIKQKFGKSPDGDQRRSCLSNSLIRRKWNFSVSSSLDRGIKETIQWFKEESL
ncbi:NAD-dependent epimerase/dehydratase family protein [Patescibacteria group bacterium]|nr:NAD-dependent epimerase/dehydratase family protein [Patescibacteria group bacterium]